MEASYKSRELTHDHPDLDMSDIVGDSGFGTRHALTQFKGCKYRGHDHLTNEKWQMTLYGPTDVVDRGIMRRECESIVHGTSSLTKLNVNPGLEAYQDDLPWLLQLED